jgi:hypothetical protein
MADHKRAEMAQPRSLATPRGRDEQGDDIDETLAAMDYAAQSLYDEVLKAARVGLSSKRVKNPPAPARRKNAMKTKANNSR